MSQTAKKATKSAATGEKKQAFSAEERAAMKERAKEMKASANKADAEKAVIEKIDELPEPERAMARRLHDIIKANAPSLSPKLWYGMPAYAKDDKVLCFFQSAHKFNTRYATLGFSDVANLDDGDLFPVVYALIEMTDAVEAKITALLMKAVS